MIVTTSLVKTFRMCPLEAYYSLQGLRKPERPGDATNRGTYIHSWLETDSKPELPEDLMEEELSIYDYLDDIYKAYKSRWKSESWEVLECEIKLERPLPGRKEHIYQGKVDKVVKIHDKIWIVDHKTHKKVPPFEYRQLDIQSHAYMWLLRPWLEENYPWMTIGGMVWDYIHMDASLEYPKVTPTGKLKLTGGKPTSKDATITACWMTKEDGEFSRLSEEDQRKVQIHLNELASKPSPGFSRVMVPYEAESHRRHMRQIIRWARQIVDTDWSTPPEDRNPVLCGNSFLCKYGKLAGSLMDTGDDSIPKQAFEVVDPLERYK